MGQTQRIGNVRSMTGAAASAIRAWMRKGWLLLLCLIATSLMATSTVHAREWIGDVSLECSGAVHSDGDADQTQGDSDKPTSHHHGNCHGQFFDVIRSGQILHASTANNQVSIGEASALRTRTIDPALRPPSA